MRDESQGRETAAIQGQILQTLEKAGGGITTVDMDESEQNDLSGFQSQNEEDDSHYYHSINKQIGLEEDAKSKRAFSQRKMSKETYQPRPSLLCEPDNSKVDELQAASKRKRPDR